MRFFTEAARKRGWKWGRRILIAAAIAVGLALIAWVTVVPGLVRRIAAGELRRMGLRNVALQVRGFSLRHVQMANVAAGEGERLRVGAVGVGFSLGGLLAGRLSVIELTGLETEIRLRDGQLDLGPLADLGGGGGEGENPFTQIQLRSSAVLLDLEGQRLRLPVWGVISDLGGGKLRLHLDADAEGAAVRLRGTVDTNTQDFRLEINGQVPDVGPLLAAQPWWPKPPLTVSGPVSIEASCARNESGLHLRAAVVQPAPFRVIGIAGGQRVSVGSIGISGGIELAGGKLQRGGWTVQARDIDAAGWRLDAADVTAYVSGDALMVSMARSRGRGWSLTLDMCRATGLMEALRGKPGDIRVETPWWELSLPPEALDAAAPALKIGSQAPITIRGRANLRLAQDVKDTKAPWTWVLEVPEARATWRAADMAVASQGVELQGIEARLQMEAQASAQRATVTVAAGSGITVDAVRLPWLELRKTAQGPQLAVELGAKGLTTTVPLGGQKPAWSLDVPELVVKLAEADLVLPDGLGEVKGCRGDFAFSIGADPKQAWLVLPRPFVASCRSAQANLGGEALRLGPLDLRYKPRDLARGGGVELDGMKPVWGRADLNIQVSGPASASLGQGDSFTIPGGDIWVAAHWSVADGGFLYASLFSHDCEARVERKLGDHVLKAHWPEADAMAYVVVGFEAQRKAALAGGFLRTPREGSPVALSIAGADATVGKAEVRGRATFGGGAPVVVGEVELDKVAVTHKASGLAVAGLAAEVPVSWNAEKAESGRFAIESIEAGGVKLANVSGTLGVADMRAEFTAAAEPLKGAKVSVEGSLDASRGEPKGMARLSLPLFKLEDENALSRLVPALKGLRASGTFGLDGFLRLAGGQVRPTLTLTALDGAFKSRAWEADAEGVFATVRLNSLAPPLTPRKELQIALVKRAKMGELEVKDGFLAFRLEPVEKAGEPVRWAAHVQRAEAGWCGGRLYDENVRFDPEAPAHTITLHAADLKLAELLPLVAGKRASGVGSVSGVLPVTIRTWPDMSFGEGRLAAAAGQRGWVQIKDLEPLQPSIDASAKAAAQGMPLAARADFEKQFRERLTQTLSDFEYDELRFDFISGSGGKELLARAFAKGRGRTGARQEVSGLTFNFTGLERALRFVLAIPRVAE